jgi:hypothetical protein
MQTYLAEARGDARHGMQGPKKGRQSHPGVFPAITKTQQDRHGWLQKKSDAARTGQPSEHIVKEASGEKL